MSERASASQSDKIVDSGSVHDVQPSPSLKKMRKHLRNDSSKAEEGSESRADANGSNPPTLSSSTRGSERRKAKKSKREASDRSRRSSCDSGAESDASGTSAPMSLKRFQILISARSSHNHIIVHLIRAEREVQGHFKAGDAKFETLRDFDNCQAYTFAISRVLSC